MITAFDTAWNDSLGQLDASYAKKELTSRRFDDLTDKPSPPAVAGTTEALAGRLDHSHVARGSIRGDKREKPGALRFYGDALSLG
jgi:hypothetical protein